MRKQNKRVLWLVYFDSTKTRSQGRRVPRSLAVPVPTLDELRKAVENSGFQFEVVSGVAHPKTWWEKTGLVIVTKKGSKVNSIRQIAEVLRKIRAQS